MTTDTRGVAALTDGTLEEAWIFLQLAVNSNFDPADPGPVAEEPQPWDLADWDLDEQYPRSLSEMLQMLREGGGDATGTGSGDDADRGHGGVPGSEGGFQGAQCAATQWDLDVAGSVVAVGAGSAGHAASGDGECSPAGDQVEAAGVAVERLGTTG